MSESCQVSFFEEPEYTTFLVVIPLKIECHLANMYKNFRSNSPYNIIAFYGIILVIL